MAKFIRSTFTDKSGSLTVDAACSLPIFIVAMALLIMLIPQAGIEESAVRGMTQSALATMDTASVCGPDPPAGASAAVYLAEFSLYKRSEGNINGVYSAPVRFGGSETLAGGIYIDNIAAASALIRTNMPVPGMFFRYIYASKNLVFRPFAGESAEAAGADPVRVYVFPKRGERYHIAACSVLKNGGVQTVLNASLRKRLKACSLCHPEGLPDGAPVYMYSSASGAFHRKSCSIVTKTYISIPRSEAIEQGYTPCMICGGGG